MTRSVGRRAQRCTSSRGPHGSRAVGGHAFCIVGYNEVGFLVQNSWGKSWGDKGFATLPYDDWLESAYDAWVARPGVPSVVSLRIRSKLLGHAGGCGFVEAPGPDPQVLSSHVVNLGNNGRLSRTGTFISSKPQIDHLFARDEPHARGVGVGAPPDRDLCARRAERERSGLDIAQRQRNWWLRQPCLPRYLRVGDRRRPSPCRTSCPTWSGDKVPAGVTLQPVRAVRPASSRRPPGGHSGGSGTR